MPIMTEGAEEAAQIAEDIKNSRPKKYRIEQLRIKDGDAYVVRPVTDRTRRGDQPGWVSVDIHSFVPTKEKPAEVNYKWPQAMWAVCRRDRMFRLPDPAHPGKRLDEFEGDYGSCYIHDKWQGVKDEKFGRDRGLPDAQVLGIAVLREPVRASEGGPVIGFRDQLVDWTDPDGKKVQIPHFVILNQKYGNFWHQIANACYVEPATATNKDFMITRKGNEYTVSAISTTPDHMTGTDSFQQQYMDVLARVGFSLEEYVVEHSTLDHYRRFFIEGEDPEGGYTYKDAEAKGEDGGAATTQAASSAAPQIDQAQMDQFAAALEKRG